MSSSASEFLKKAWEIYGLVLRYLTYIAVFVGGSSLIVYGLRTDFCLSLPNFGLTFFESTIVWGVLATPLYVVAVSLLAISIMFAAVFVYLSWIVLKHAPEIVAVFVEVWREYRNGS